AGELSGMLRRLRLRSLRSRAIALGALLLLTGGLQTVALPVSFHLLDGLRTQDKALFTWRYLAIRSDESAQAISKDLVDWNSARLAGDQTAVSRDSLRLDADVAEMRSDAAQMASLNLPAEVAGQTSSYGNAVAAYTGFVDTFRAQGTHPRATADAV